jgi:hypothetical protein
MLSRSDKHTIAYDKYGNKVRIEDAKKFIDGKKVTYFFDLSMNCRMVNVFDEIKQPKHWRRHPKGEVVMSNGQRINANSINESIEHQKFKKQIVYDNFFYYNKIKILLQNTKEEYTPIGTRYRIDVYGELLDGTPCFIEVINTSDVSDLKVKYIKQREILTFKIYINKDGSQRHEEFDIIGNSTIDGIKEGIGDSRKKLRLRKNEIEYDFIRCGDRIDEVKKEVRKLADNISKQERDFENELQQTSGFKQISTSEVSDITRRIKEYKRQTLEHINKIEYSETLRTKNIKSYKRKQSNSIFFYKRKVRQEIKCYQEKIDKFYGRISEVKNRIRERRTEFNTLAENCKIEWFRNSFIKSTGIDKLTEILYWCS